MKKLIYLILLISFEASATQIKEVYSDQEIMVRVSNKDLNRIHLRGDKVSGIRFNNEDINASKDSITGDVYFRIQGYGTKIMYIVTKKKKTYKLLLLPKKIPSEQIILVNPTLISEKEFSLSDEYKQGIITLVKESISNKIPSGYEVVNLKRTLRSKNSLLKVAQFKEISPVDGTGIKVLFAEIKNRSKKTITITKNDFFTKGVRAFLLSDSVLQPKQKGLLILVK